MKQLLKFSTIFVLLLTATLLVSCKDAKESHDHDGGDHDHDKEMAYICPMDCEDGKTYEEAGTCPVCKMDLKKVAHSDGDMASCPMHKDGKCNHADGECTCADCPEHGDKTTCTMHKDGTCTHPEGECTCEDCPVHKKE